MSTCLPVRSGTSALSLIYLSSDIEYYVSMTYPFDQNQYVKILGDSSFSLLLCFILPGSLAPGERRCISCFVREYVGSSDVKWGRIDSSLIPSILSL